MRGTERLGTLTVKPGEIILEINCGVYLNVEIMKKKGEIGAKRSLLPRQNVSSSTEFFFFLIVLFQPK